MRALLIKKGDCGSEGTDQGAHNLIVYEGAVGAAIMATETGPVCTVGLAENVTMDADGMVLDQRGARCALVHQFDRWPDVEARVDAEFSL